MGTQRNRPSTVDKLPPEVREEINRLRLERGWSIDELIARLREIGHDDISRSAMGRHVRALSEVADKMRRSREITEALARMSDRADNKMLRGTIELVNSILLEVSLAEEEGEDGSINRVSFNPLEVKALAQTVESLARAEKVDQDRLEKAEKRAAAKATAEAAKNAAAAARAQGLSKDGVAAIRHAVLGA
ncbi:MULTISPECIES: phage protein Gp27 family protein [unclassified Sphingobium]|uniref:phage protein Gp27 family protein n=1 Tax=unclassified Sphingobium TaxID=2611147 RepID=UPI0035A5D1F5